MRVLMTLAVAAVIVACPLLGAATADSEAPVDPRLSRKVTYEAKHKPVKVILADLSRMTGITLKAGITTRDWQVRDRRMNIFVKDLLLLSLMNSMARVMDFTWDKNTRLDPPTYRMYMDRKKLAAAEAAKTRADQSFRRHMMEQRAKFVDYVKNPPDYSPAELEKLKEENPYLYLLRQRGTDRLMKAFLEEVPGYEEAFMTYERILNPPARILSDSTLDLLLSCMKAKASVPGTRWGGGAPFPADVDIEWLKKGLVRLTVPTPELVRTDTRWCFGGLGAIVGPTEFYIEELRDPEDPFGQALAKAEIESMERNAPYYEVRRQSWPEMERLFREDARKREESEGCEPLVEHVDKPWLREKVKLRLDKDDPMSLRNVLDSLAEASGYNVVSDSFKLTFVVGNMSAVEQELTDTLAVISDYYGYNWNKHGSILEFRDRNWFRRRRTQIPDEWMERWKANFKANGEAVLDDIAQMAALPFEQLDENVDTEPVFQMSDGFIWTIRNGRGMLRVYNSFSPSQRKALLRTGVEFGGLTPEQRELAVDAFEPMDTMEWNPPRFWEDPDERLVFTGRFDRPAEGEPTFILRVTGRQGKVYVEKAIALRKYVEPPKPAPEKEEARKNTSAGK
ncbi:MAG: hypothetical protein Q7T82_02415 [Armatimonadota bacterium]|nr:hypothetical protein [Armatimonadota bacterium]